MSETDIEQRLKRVEQLLIALTQQIATLQNQAGSLAQQIFYVPASPNQ